MAYSVDWVAKVFTIPQSDLTFLGGNNYSLSLVDVHKELRRLEWGFVDGLWAQLIAKWYETVTLSGVDKTPSVEIINGYTFNFTGSNYNVILSAYDNNLVDVYAPSNGISILGNNSVGKQTVASVGATQEIVTAIWEDNTKYDEGSKGHLLEHTDYIEHTVFIDTELAPTVGEGTELQPFGITSDAIDFAELHGFRKLGLLSELIVDRQIKNFLIYGVGGVPSVLTNGKILEASSFYQVNLSGVYTGRIVARDCYITGTNTTINGVFKNCGFGSTFEVPDGNTASIVGSYALVGLGFIKPVFSIGGVSGTGVLEMMGFNGGVTITNCNQPTDNVKIIATGIVEIDATCTDGVIVILGNIKPIDNSGPGCDVQWYSLDAETVNKALTLPQFLGLK